MFGDQIAQLGGARIYGSGLADDSDLLIDRANFHLKIERERFADGNGDVAVHSWPETVEFGANLVAADWEPGNQVSARGVSCCIPSDPGLKLRAEIFASCSTAPVASRTVPLMFAVV